MEDYGTTSWRAEVVEPLTATKKIEIRFARETLGLFETERTAGVRSFTLATKREAKKMRKLTFTIAATLGLLALTPVSAIAQDWPQKQVIRMIVPFPAGGGTDVVARIVAKYLSERLHQAIVVENRGGANGQIGLQTLKQSAPDGYTIEVTSDTPMTVNPWIYKNLPYDPLRDFIPVVSLIRLPSMLAVHPSVPARSVAEFIALAKSKPGSLTYASAGVGNFSHLEMELFALAAGVKLVHVPYKGTGPSAMGLIGGEVQVAFNNVSTLLPHAQAGKLIALAVAEPKRIPELPDIPAIAETLPGFEMAPWVGLVVPTGTPQPIVDRLAMETIVVMRDPVVIKQFNEQQLNVMVLEKDKFAELIRNDLEKWGKVTKAAGVTMQ
jgi:tripartite-type tricarboxylate transporter receptor subunit TctC